MKKIILVLAFIILIWPLNSFAAQVCYDDSVATAFDNTVAGAMVVALEQAKISESQIEALSGSSQELLQQKEILQGTIRLLQDQIATYKSMSEMNAKMSDMADKACKEQVKAAAPTFSQNIGKYFTGAGVGAILSTALILLL